VAALRQVCRLLRDANRDKGRFFVKVNRAAIVDTVVAEFAYAPKEKLLQKLSVAFSGEQGIDAGGLTKDMFTAFFAALTSPECGLFECDGDAEKPTYLPVKEAEGGEGEDPLLASYEAVGRVIAKAVLDEMPLPNAFHPTLFRALLRGTRRLPVNLHELEAFSPTEARSCRQVDDHGEALPMCRFNVCHPPPPPLSHSDQETPLPARVCVQAPCDGGRVAARPELRGRGRRRGRDQRQCQGVRAAAGGGRAGGTAAW